MRGPVRVQSEGRNGLNVLVGHLVTDRQTMTTLGTTAGQNLAAVLGFHARTKTVLVDALAIAGLVSSLHRKQPCGKRGRMYILNPLKFKGLKA